MSSQPSFAPADRRSALLPTALLLLTGMAGIGFASPVAAQVTVEWVQPTRGVAIAVDDGNNVFTLDYEYALGAEMTVTKRDVNGNLLWVSSFDQTSPTQWERASWIATAGDGSAIACGTLMSGYSNPVPFASIVVKFAPDGQVLWRNVYANGADGGTRRCLVDPDGDVFVLGLGSGPPGYVTRVDRFTSDGEAAWSWYDEAGIGAPVNFKFTPDGDLVIAARGIIGSVNGYARIDRRGRTMWSLPGVQSLTVGDIAGDSLGNAYVVHGEYATNGGTQIKKVDASGGIVFDRNYDLSAFRIEVGADDRAVACGFPNPNQGGAAFVKIDEQGDVVWTNLDADGPGHALLLHALLVLDASGDAYLAAGTLFEMAVCKVGADGTSRWTQTVSGSYATSMVLGRHDDSVFVVGGTTTRWSDPEEGPWHDLGNGLAGSAGTPLLIGQGALHAGTPFTWTVSGAAPNSAAALVLGASPLMLPFKGGVLVPTPDLALLGLGTDAHGDLVLSALTPPGLPSAAHLFLQAWVMDAAGAVGWSASHGLRATLP